MIIHYETCRLMEESCRKCGLFGLSEVWKDRKRAAEFLSFSKERGMGVENEKQITTDIP